MTPSLKLASPTDVETLLPLMRLLQADDPWSVPFDDTAVRLVVHDLLANPAVGLAYWVCDGDQIVGYIVLCFDYSLEYGGKGAWVDEFFVRREFRGKGIGSDVLRLAEDEARKAGATVLHLEVNHGNPALELYRRHGFEDHARYLMTKWLA